MPYSYALPTLARANDAAAGPDPVAVWRILRELPMADFCDTVLDPPAAFPALRSFLPSMPPEEIQKRWTGHAGRDLRIKSSNALRLMQSMAFAVRGRGIRGPVLDYGCGWGRLLRIATRFCDPADLHGVDPLEDSLKACREHRVQGVLTRIDAMPDAMPTGEVRFDFAFSFSVMSHTSRASTEAILRALRPSMAEGGLYATTIRPVEFWTQRARALGQARSDKLIADHDTTGYAFVPVGGGKELTAEHYGDSSFSPELFGQIAAATGWRLVAMDRDITEPNQIMMMLQPA